MSDFDTVFEITSGSNGVLTDMLFRLFVGVAALVVGVWAMIGARKRGITGWIAPVFTLVWSLSLLHRTIFLALSGTLTVWSVPVAMDVIKSSRTGSSFSYATRDRALEGRRHRREWKTI